MDRGRAVTLDRNVCFGRDPYSTQQYIEEGMAEWTKAVREHIAHMSEEETRQLLLDAVDLLGTKENPTWGDYRFLTQLRDKIDDILG